jgi:hypothetical protein
MLQRILAAGWITAAVLFVANGCCMDRHWCAGGCCGGTVAADAPCGPGAPCGAGCCDGCGPLGFCEGLLTCGSGCGEMYWGEWLSDPPACCDPCDPCGQWVGSCCCRPGWLCAGLHTLWGLRYEPQCCDPCCAPCCDPCGGDCVAGCSQCGGGYAAAEAYDGQIIEGPVIADRAVEDQTGPTHQSPATVQQRSRSLPSTHASPQGGYYTRSSAGGPRARVSAR